MKVLHFYRTAIPDTMGGVEQFIHQMASGCVKHGVHSTVLSLTHGQAQVSSINQYLSYRVKCDFELASTDFSLSAFFEFSKLAKAADIVHYHYPWPFMDLVHFFCRVNKPSIVTYHSDIIRQKNLLKLYRPLQRLFLADVNRIVATSPHYFETSEVLCRYKNKVSVIPIGLDKTTYIQPSLDREAYWLKKFGDDFFVFVGVLRYYKGLDVLIDAVKGAPFRVLIIGIGPMETELKRRVAIHGLDNVIFLGKLSDEDKIVLIKLSRAMVFPSNQRSEAFGISLLEAAMYGKPMISCEIGTGTTYINMADETGLVVPPNDVPALRQAMCDLWSNNDKATAMGRKAEQRYLTHFSAEKMIDSYVDLYRNLLN